MNVSWKINMLLEIETCEDFVDFFRTGRYPINFILPEFVSY